MSESDLHIWKWTLTKEAIAPCFVRDVLEMRPSNNNETDFFWLGYTPCRTVLLVGMVVAIQVYDKRAIYTIDDGTAVIDCVLRYPALSLPALVNSRFVQGPSTKTNPERSPPKKPRLGKTSLESMEPPPPITEPGYPVRVVGKVVRHYQSKQVHAEAIDPCPSTLDEIAHLAHVIELHKIKYSCAIPFVIPLKPASTCAPAGASTSHARLDMDTSVFSSTSSPSCKSTSQYTLPAPPRLPILPQNRNHAPSGSTHVNFTIRANALVPSSPTASSIASSTPSSPCKPSSPIKTNEVSRKPKLRHPSRLHTRDLTANTFRLYVKHYMDNAPSDFAISCMSPCLSTCKTVTTPTKQGRNERWGDEPTPRPRYYAKVDEAQANDKGNGDEPAMGFTLSHLRRVPELALLAARIVRTETRKRDKAEREREKQRANSRITSISMSSGRPSCNENKTAHKPPSKTATDPPHKKMKRLFSWAVVKLYEEGSIVLWDGEVRPLPVPPEAPSSTVLWNDGATHNSVLDWHSTSSPLVDVPTCTSTSVLYTSSASASLYSHYHAPRRHRHEDPARDVHEVDPYSDTAYLSDPGMDEEAYVPLTPELLAGYVREAICALRRGSGATSTRERSGASASANGGSRGGGNGREPTAGEVLAHMRRKDARWARVGVWAVEEAFVVIKARHALDILPQIITPSL